MFSLVLASSFPAIAAEKPSAKWDTLVEIAYRFTWYPQKDLQELLEKKSQEYGQSLKEYQNMLIAELTDRDKISHNLVYDEGFINPEFFVKGKPWKLYYRLAISQFCTFLAKNDEIYLQNAKSLLSLVLGKKELGKVSYWDYLFKAYSDLMKEDRDSFVKSVHDLWNNSITKSELDDLVISSYIHQSNTNDDLRYLYENIANLIITKAIIEKQIPNLSSLSVIITSLKDKLTIENGYKHFVEAIVARFRGLKSDNYNLNFAVAFVEATANQYEFEDEKSAQLIVNKYNSVRTSYEFALSLASTSKGQAAILTQYMGFNNYLIRRLIDKDSLLSANAVFRGVVEEAQGLADKSIALYDQLAELSVRENGFLEQGFSERGNYIEAMHQLWDSSAKLLITASMYYQMNHQAYETTKKNSAQGPLLKYFRFFDRYARFNREIVPDNAFFLTAHAASQMSDLYKNAAKYSTSIETNNQAFNYQVQAVVLFPLDIMGILKLAHQADQEGRHSKYLQYVLPLASRLRDSNVTRVWLNKPLTDHKKSIAMTTNVIPNIVDNAFLYINVLQQTEGSGSQTEEDLYNKVAIMSKLQTALRERDLEEKIPNILASIAEHYDPENNSSLKKSLDDELPKDLRVRVKSILEVRNDYDISRLKHELYASPDIRIHSFLRELYFENHDKINSPFLLSNPIFF
jgi:hypothetical protein